jgi:Zn-dependent M16 (insulinase) family peptidase
MSEQFSLYTTGLDVTFDSYLDSESGQVKSFLQFSIACLNRNLDKTLDLITKLSSEIEIKDTKHMATLLRN